MHVHFTNPKAKDVEKEIANLAHEHSIPTWPNTNPFDLNTQKRVDHLYICFCFLRQLSIHGAIRGFCFPPFHRDVFNFNILQNFEIGWEIGNFMAFIEIFDSDFNFREIVQDVQFRKIDGCVAVDLGGVTKLDKIEPAAATFTTCRRPVLTTLFLEVSTNILKSAQQRKEMYIELLGREWTRSDTRGVRFDDSDGFLDFLRWNSETSTNPANGCRRGSDVGISSEIEIQHDCVSTFAQYSFLISESSLHE